MYFAYRQFTGNADAVLAAYGFGRAHHRAMHFIGRAPGLTVAELLETLEIRKQSLNRVLRQLVDEGYVTQAQGESDRRQRRLYLTEAGERLWRALRDVQEAHFREAYRGLEAEEIALFERVLERLIGTGDRPAAMRRFLSG